MKLRQPIAPQPEGEASRMLLLRAIRMFRQEGNDHPRLDQLATRTGLGKDNVAYHLRYLVRQGRVRLGPVAREIVIVHPTDGLEP